MARRPMQDKDVMKMVNPSKVIIGCLVLGGLKKTVDRMVK